MPVLECHHGIDEDRHELPRQLRNEDLNLWRVVEQQLLQTLAEHQRRVD